MALPLDNPGNLAIRSVAEPSAVRTDPVFEFSRKKSPGYVTETVDRAQMAPDPGEFTPLRLAELPQITLPRDATKPLVTGDNSSAKAALEAYKSLRTRLLRTQASQGLRAVAVTSAGHAEGKTLTAFNLANCCARMENFSVLLIDGDLRSGGLSKLIGGLPSVGLADVVSGTASCEQTIVRTDLPNLYVMGAGRRDVPATELLSTERWSQVMRWSRNQFKMVLVDAQSMGAYADFELVAEQCDGVLLVVRARSTSRDALKMSVEQLDTKKLVGIVWNGSEGETGFYS